MSLPAPHPPESEIRIGLQIKDIIIDCLDLELVSTFWSALLGQPVAARLGPYVLLERQGGVRVGFQAVQELSAGKNRLHLDLGSPNPAAEQARVEALGGRRVPGFEDGGFLVLADPEGNQFCVIPSEPFDVDAAGRASYLRPDAESTVPA